MRYAADVVHLTARPQDDDRFCIVAVEGANAAEAARKVAEIAAVRKYEELGCVGFLTRASDHDLYRRDASGDLFRASIGEQRKSEGGIALDGVTIAIHVWPVE